MNELEQRISQLEAKIKRDDKERWKLTDAVARMQKQLEFAQQYNQQLKEDPEVALRACAEDRAEVEKQLEDFQTSHKELEMELAAKIDLRQTLHLSIVALRQKLDTIEAAEDEANRLLGKLQRVDDGQDPTTVCYVRECDARKVDTNEAEEEL